jgi:hypothetical protein
LYIIKVILFRCNNLIFMLTDRQIKILRSREGIAFLIFVDKLVCF